MKNYSTLSDEENEKVALLRLKLAHGVLIFYIINLAGLLIGVIGIKLLGNLKGIVFTVITIFALQVIAGYVTLKITVAE